MKKQWIPPPKPVENPLDDICSSCTSFGSCAMSCGDTKRKCSYFKERME